MSAATPATDAQRLAEATAQAMWARDRTVQALGLRLQAVRPGYALIQMSVRADMVNGHHIAHGGMLFTLADTAFAYACNSYDHNTVAAGCSIEFLAPAREGDVLEAEAIERTLSGRNGIYDVTVRWRGGAPLALFRGKSRRIAGSVIAGLQADAQ